MWSGPRCKSWNAPSAKRKGTVATACWKVKMNAFVKNLFYHHSSSAKKWAEIQWYAIARSERSTSKSYLHNMVHSVGHSRSSSSDRKETERLKKTSKGWWTHIQHGNHNEEFEARDGSVVIAICASQQQTSASTGITVRNCILHHCMQRSTLTVHVPLLRSMQK